MLVLETNGEPRELPVRETGGWGNKHWNLRRPEGPVCPACGEPWQPVCPNLRCPEGKATRAVIRASKRDRNTRYYGGRR